MKMNNKKQKTIRPVYFIKSQNWLFGLIRETMEKSREKICLNSSMSMQVPLGQITWLFMSIKHASNET